MLNNLRKTISNLIYPAKNSMSIANDFLRNGSRNMNPDWTQVVMSDKDIYTGYPYAAIRNRANYVARVAIENIKTTSLGSSGKEHPYLDIIDLSPSFSNYQFWYAISTFLDLEGIYYLMALRNKEGERYGKIKEFKLLNPYEIKRIIDRETGNVAGYQEYRDGLVRDIPTEMIIEMRELNPFSKSDPLAMTDAAKESQFTLKTSGDYTRHALKHNINAPGIMTTDVILEDNKFKNFVARVKSHTKGEPLFGNGDGAIKWADMNTDISKAALKDINEINREQLFSVAGMSKTMMGIEQSGTTRETAKVQKDLLIQNQTLPRVQLIIDALNQDYKNTYKNEYSSSKIEITVEDPTNTDHDAEIKVVEVKQKTADLYTSLVEKGYNPELVAKYINGEIDVSQLGKPTAKKEVITESVKHTHEHDQKKNQLNDSEDGLVKQQEGLLRNSIINIEEQIVAEAINKVTLKVKNEFESETDLIPKSNKNEYINELELVMIGFFGVILTLQGTNIMRNRTEKFMLPGLFSLDQSSKNYAKRIAKKIAESHVSTVIDDLLKTVREASLEGLGQQQIIGLIKQKYNGVISETRATTIARTEANRAFTRAQYEADRQFIKQNKLGKRAFKEWKTRSDDPCPFCKELESQGKIPFDQAFANLGENIVADDKTLPINFEALQAGNAHPNCSCVYQLIIEDK